MIHLSDVIASLEEWAPPALQESYDNCGLITGDPEAPCSGILVCLDSLEAVVEEAIAKNCNLIVAHHPIVFSGLKKFSGNDYVLRVLKKAIRHDIAIYALHTSLDNVKRGVNQEMARRLQLKECRILQPKSGVLQKLVCFCPAAHAKTVREAMFNAGAGNIGNYDYCSFNTEGKGTFRAGEGADPYVGEIGTVHEEAEVRIEVVLPEWKEKAVLRALFNAHPYEEVAYDLYRLKNMYQHAGAGMIGELSEPVATGLFLRRVKEVFGGVVRHTAPVKDTVSSIALCGGSGSFLLKDAIKAGADVFITGDFKYHQFFDADGQILIADIGHFESEQFTMSLIQRYLLEKFPNFAVLLTTISTNPVHYI